MVSFGVPEDGSINLLGLKVSEDLVGKYLVFIIVLFNIHLCLNRVLSIDSAAAFFAFIRQNQPEEILFTHPVSKKNFTRANVLHSTHKSSLDRIYPLFSVMSHSARNRLTFVVRPIIEVIIVGIPYVGIIQTLQKELLGKNIYTLVLTFAMLASVLASGFMFARGFKWLKEARD